MKQTQTRKPVIFWFRNDLRLTDHVGLQAALASGRPLLAVYILDDEHAGPESPGGASRWWLHHSLESLQHSLYELGGRLCLRRGETLETLLSLLAETGAEALYYTRAYEPWAASLESRIDGALKDQIKIRRFSGRLLFEPETLKTAAGRPFKVFTPFWKACLKKPEPQGCLPAPVAIDFYTPFPMSDPLGGWQLLPQTNAWTEGFKHTWKPGEEGALEALEHFLKSALMHYPSDRDRPDLNGTSRLSPHLHFGELSPRQVWMDIRHYQAGQPGFMQAAECYSRQLGWREFCHYLLFHWPELVRHPFRENFVDFSWQTDPDLQVAWQQGETGYPIVDAGMRELLYSGWMHNRVRMITASFLVKDLLQPWQVGEAWFWDTLVDADLANNTCGWQWVAGCGVDAAPYFRIFNPVMQGKKFDPDGAYVKRWLPQLADLPPHYVHDPWNAPAIVLQQAGLVLGRDYPLPTIDHAQARRRALAIFAQIKSEASVR